MSDNINAYNDAISNDNNGNAPGALEQRIISLEKRVAVLEAELIKKQNLAQDDAKVTIIEPVLEQTPALEPIPVTEPLPLKTESKPDASVSAPVLVREKPITTSAMSYSSRMMANTQPDNIPKQETPVKREPIAMNKPQVSMESKIGKNVMGILASVLIFISILIFGGMVYSQLGEVAKSVVLIVLSLALAATGLIKMKRNDSYFVLFSSMAACGICALYITFMLMHFVFDILPLGGLTIAMFIWTGAVVGLSVAKDKMFSYICLAGIIITTIVCAINWDNAGWGLIYYAVSSIILYVLGKNKDYNRNIFYFLQIPIMGMILTGIYYESIVAIICITVFVVGCLIAQNFMYQIEGKNLSVNIPVTIVSMLFVVISMIHMSFTLGYSLIKYPYIVLIVLIAIVYGFKYAKNNLAAFLSAYYFAVAMVAIVMYDNIWIFAIAMLVLGAVFANNHFRYVSYGFTAIGILLCSQQVLFENFGDGYIPMIFISAIIIICAAIYNHLRYSKIDKYIITGLTAFLIINAHINDLYGVVVEFLLLAVLSLYMNINYYRFNRITKEKEEGSVIAGYVVNAFVMLFSLNLIWFSDEICKRGDQIDGINLILTILAVLFTIAIFVINNKNLFGTKISEKAVGTYLDIKFTILIFSVLHLFAPAAFIVSVVGLIIAIGSIVLGFKVKIKAFRLYGLILTLICVAKLILFDIEYESILLKPLGFFVAGVLCFVISWIYSRLEKKNEEEEHEVSSNNIN